jgi:MerR family transcriptional regulator, copper efflux regulator
MWRRTGFSAATLRYYEEIRLLPESQRTSVGYRLYDDRTVARLAFIARAKQLGCSLEEIADLLAAWDGPHCGPVRERLRTRVDSKIKEAQQRVAELIAFTAQLQQAAAAYACTPQTGRVTTGVDLDSHGWPGWGS